MSRTASLIVASVLMAAIAACSAQAAPDPVVGLPGMRDSEASPVGDPLVLPDGVELVDPVLTYNFFDEEDCKNPEGAPDQTIGNDAGAVHLCLVFRNRTGRPITVELPPGLIFESENLDLQNGMLIQKASIEVPAGQISVKAKLDCINVTRISAIAFTGGRYHLGPVTRHPHIVEALGLLADRDLSDVNAAAQAHIVISDLLDGDALDARGRASAASLPVRRD